VHARRLEVDAHRIGRWVLGFSDRHDGARVLTSGSGVTGDCRGTGHPGATGDSGRTGGDRTGEGQQAGAEELVLEGGDGARAELRRWTGPAGGADAARVSSGVVPAGLLDAEVAEAITDWAQPPQHLGLILVRRGGYSVGLSDGAELAAHKSGTRYVQSRTAAGGWSQQRFARRRGNQAAALIDSVVEHATRLLVAPPQGRAEHKPTALVLGGDRALAAEVIAARELATLAGLPQRMLADLSDPRHSVLRQALRRGRSVPISLTEAH